MIRGLIFFMNLKVSDQLFFFCCCFFILFSSIFFYFCFSNHCFLVLKSLVSFVFLYFHVHFYLINVPLFHLLFSLLFIFFLLIPCVEMIHHDNKISQSLFLFLSSAIHKIEKRINFYSLCLHLEAVTNFISKLRKWNFVYWTLSKRLN